VVAQDCESLKIKTRLAPPVADRPRSHYTQVSKQALEQQSGLIEQIVGFTFDVLGALHVEVRIYDAEACE
jgi:hypothetical protein